MINLKKCLITNEKGDCIGVLLDIEEYLKLPKELEELESIYAL